MTTKPTSGEHQGPALVNPRARSARRAGWAAVTPDPEAGWPEENKVKNERKVRVGDRVEIVAKWAKSSGISEGMAGTVRAFKPMSFEAASSPETDWVGVEWDGLKAGNNLDGLLPVIGAGWWVGPEAVKKARTVQTWKYRKETSKVAPALDTEVENNGFYVHAPFVTVYVHVGFDGDVSVTYWGRGKVKVSVDDRAQADELRRF